MAIVPDTGLQIRSLLAKDGTLQLSLARVPVVAPASDEVLIRVEATPINPSTVEKPPGPALTTRRSPGPTGGQDMSPTTCASSPM